eukprot:11205606-Lingulodinium_polyedra.AAC.1
MPGTTPNLASPAPWARHRTAAAQPPARPSALRGATSTPGGRLHRALRPDTPEGSAVNQAPDDHRCPKPPSSASGMRKRLAA